MSPIYRVELSTMSILFTRAKYTGFSSRERAEYHANTPDICAGKILSKTLIVPSYFCLAKFSVTINVFSYFEKKKERVTCLVTFEAKY